MKYVIVSVISFLLGLFMRKIIHKIKKEKRKNIKQSLKK